ncbi:tetratricopeptide repeat protein [Microcoleus sp. F6_B4]|uniref:tetratricopeptide repeat protein n=1 Tax=Microcoleus sp. herbarium5 TaxID=3055434 RepID=UPI002FCF0D23
MTLSQESVLSKIGIEPSYVKFINPIWKRAHRRAAVNWLTKYHSPQAASNLQKVHGYLEAFHHLSVVGAWEESSEIILLQIDTPTQEELHKQLHTWGYYHQQIELYKNLLWKLNYKWDVICLSGIGNAYDALGEDRKAVDYHKQHLQLARDNGDRREVALALCNLGLESPFPGEVILTAFFDIERINIKSILPRWKRTQYRAIFNWLIKYNKPLDSINSLEIVRGILESFHHLFAVEAWEEATKIITLRLNLTVNEELHNHLYIWGYYRELIELYNQTLGKSNPKWDAICLAGIGRAYNALGDFCKAMDYLDQSLDISKHLGDRRREGIALSQLGTSYRSLGDSSTAIDYYQQSFTIAKEIGDLVHKGITLGELGITYSFVGMHNQAIESLQKSLWITQEAGSKVGQVVPLYGLSVFHLQQRRYDQAIEYSQQQLNIAREISYIHGEGNALSSLGEVRNERNQHSEAIDNYQQALEIFKSIGALESEAKVVSNLAKIHYKLGERILALEHCDRALSIATELDIPLKKECREFKQQLESSHE